MTARGVRSNASSATNYAMTLCPIALAVGCQKCPAFKVCPLKGVIGDQKAVAEPASKTTKARAAKKK